MTDDPTLAVAQDLGAIQTLHHGLLVQAWHKANAREMPGGLAMACLGPVASPEAVLNVVDTIETRRPEWLDELGDNDDDWEPPLQTLLYWTEALRAKHDALIDRPTPLTEAKYLIDNLETMRRANGDSHWDDFCRDISTARRRLENLLQDGIREERAWVPCMETNCERDRDGEPIYIRLVPDKSGPSPDDDGWKCPRCRSRYDDTRYRLAAQEALARFGGGDAA